MIVSTILFVFMSLFMTAYSGTAPIVKRGLQHYDELDSYQFEGHNSIEDYGHYHHFAPSLPAYSTVSYIMVNGHHKPVSYSGFTNHGRGHHDPGYSVQYRSDGFHYGGDDHHHYF